MSTFMGVWPNRPAPKGTPQVCLATLLWSEIEMRCTASIKLLVRPTFSVSNIKPALTIDQSTTLILKNKITKDKLV